MFDIGFSEILVIGVVALIVIGPERLPKTARMLGHLFGRLQRYVSEVKSDISREMELDELRRLQREVKGVATDLQQSMTSVASEVRTSARDIENQLNAGAGQVADVLPAGETAGASPPVASGAAAPEGSAESSRQTSLPGFDKL